MPWPTATCICLALACRSPSYGGPGGWRPGLAVRAGCRRTCGVLAIAALTGLAIRQTSFWHDDVTLWQHSLATTEDNAEAEFSLAVALTQRDRLDEALACYHRASKWHVEIRL